MTASADIAAGGTTAGVTEGERQPETVNTAPTGGLEANARRTLPVRRRGPEPTNPVTLGEWFREWVTGLRAEATPPNLWTDSRPCLRSSWLYARHGTQAPAEGPGRQMCRASAWLAVPLRALALYADWLAERPSRLLAAFVLYVVVAQFLPISPDWLTF